MTGRAIDQVLPYPGNPRICEPYAKSALTYVELAEKAHGPIPKPVSFAYIWGDALPEFRRRSPDLRIVNLETSITVSETCTDSPAKTIGRVSRNQQQLGELSHQCTSHGSGLVCAVVIHDNEFKRDVFAPAHPRQAANSGLNVLFLVIGRDDYGQLHGDSPVERVLRNA